MDNLEDSTTICRDVCITDNFEVGHTDTDYGLVFGWFAGVGAGEGDIVGFGFCVGGGLQGLG